MLHPNEQLLSSGTDRWAEFPGWVGFPFSQLCHEKLSKTTLLLWLTFKSANSSLRLSCNTVICTNTLVYSLSSICLSLLPAVVCQVSHIIALSHTFSQLPVSVNFPLSILYPSLFVQQFDPFTFRACIGHVSMSGSLRNPLENPTGHMLDSLNMGGMKRCWSW